METCGSRMVPAPPDLEEAECLAVGKRLLNGAVVVASKTSTSHGPKVWVVLAVSPGYEPYVTWISDGEECSWGHYFTGLADALDDFAKRT